jgi:hypothetical protein
MEPDRQRPIDAREFWTRLRAREYRRAQRRFRWPFEQHLYECIVFPLLKWVGLAGLAVLLAVAAWLALVTPAAVASVAEWAAHRRGSFFDQASDTKWKGLLGLAGLLALFAAPPLILTFGYLHWVLSAAAAGEPLHRGWPVLNVRHWLRGTGRCLAALLAGPVELAVLGFYYWMECGDPTWLDGIILAEMGIAAVGCGLFALAAMTSGRPAEFKRLRAVVLAHRLGWCGAALVLFASAAVLFHGWLALAAIEKINTTGSGFFG